MNNYTGMNRNMNTDRAGRGEDPRKLTGFAAELYEWLEAIAFALAIVVLLFTFVFRIVSVVGVSMNDTLFEDDRVLVWSIFYTPEQNDVVITLPEEVTDENAGDLNKPLVKRVVATEGQFIEIREGYVYVADSEELLGTVQPFEAASPVADDAVTLGGSFLPDDTPMQVDEGCVFVMGDNRDSSTDSRDSRVGFIKNANILGKVIFRIYPFDDSFGKIL